MTELDKTLKGMEFETPECEEIELDEEETELNVAPLRVDDEQFGFIALTLRNRMTSAVGESMQFIEIASMTDLSRNALKAAVKRSIWLAVRDTLKAVADISELDGREAHALIYGDKN